MAGRHQVICERCGTVFTATFTATAPNAPRRDLSGGRPPGQASDPGQVTQISHVTEMGPPELTSPTAGGVWRR